MNNIDIDDNCSLCCEKFDCKYHLIKLSCGHYFHAIKRNEIPFDIPEWIINTPCIYNFLIRFNILPKSNHPNCYGIQKWLSKQKTCPICRSKIEDNIFEFI